MHELAVCQGMMAQVTDIARQRAANSIALIRVRIGPLSGIEPQLLEQAFSVASAGSIAEGATLVLEDLPVTVHCERCDRVTDAKANRLLCGHCGDFHTRLVSGDELILASVELRTGQENQ